LITGAADTFGLLLAGLGRKTAEINKLIHEKMLLNADICNQTVTFK
jgi:hypothetical protein